MENRSESTCYPKEGDHIHVLNGGKTLVLAFQFPFGLCKEERGFFESPTKDTKDTGESMYQPHSGFQLLPLFFG